MCKSFQIAAFFQFLQKCNINRKKAPEYVTSRQNHKTVQISVQTWGQNQETDLTEKAIRKISTQDTGFCCDLYSLLH